MPCPKLASLHHFNMETGALECVLDTPQGAFRVYCLHLGSLAEEERLLQIDHLLASHRNAAQSGPAWTGNGKTGTPSEDTQVQALNWDNGEQPPPIPQHTIWLGDFNSEPDGAEYARFTGRPDAASGQVVFQKNFVDAWTTAKARDGSGTTWLPDPPDRSPGRGMQLDYCFLSPELGSCVRRAWIDEGATGSDHKPFWVELELPQE